MPKTNTFKNIMNEYLHSINCSNDKYPIENVDYFINSSILSNSQNTNEMYLVKPQKVTSSKQFPFVGEWYPTYSFVVKLNGTHENMKFINRVIIFLSKMFIDQACILFTTHSHNSMSYYLVNGKIRNSDSHNDRSLIINGIGNNNVTGSFQYFNIGIQVPNSMNIDEYYPINTFKNVIEECDAIRMKLAISNTNVIRNNLTPKDLFDFLVEDVVDHVSKRISPERTMLPNIDLWYSLLEIADEGKYLGLKCKLRNTGGEIDPSDEIIITLYIFHVPIFTSEYQESHENYLTESTPHYPVVLKNSYQLGMKELNALTSGLLTKTIKIKNAFKNIPIKILINIQSKYWIGTDFVQPVMNNYDIQYPEYIRNKYLVFLSSMPGVKTIVKKLTHNIFAIAFFPERKRKIPFIGSVSIKDNFDYTSEDYDKLRETTEMILFYLPIRFVKNKTIQRKNIHISYKVGYHPFSPVPFEHFACIPIDQYVGGRCSQEIDLQHYFKGFSGSSKKMNRIECESCDSIKQPDSCEKCMICNPPKCKICKEPVKMNRINLNSVIIRIQKDDIFSLHRKCALESSASELDYVDYSIPQTQDFQRYYNLPRIDSNTIGSNKLQCKSC